LEVKCAKYDRFKGLSGAVLKNYSDQTGLTCSKLVWATVQYVKKKEVSERQ